VLSEDDLMIETCRSVLSVNLEVLEFQVMDVCISWCVH